MRKFLVLLCFGFLLTSCEDVVDISLNTAEPRLVIEANINVRKENGNSYNSFVRLSTTTSFYEDDVPPVEDAVVTITDENNTIVPFVHEENGYYYADLIPEPNMKYTLEIIYENEVYSATTELKTTSFLEGVEQKDDGGFLGDQIELKTFFNDPPDEENFYYFFVQCSREYRRSVSNDEFYNGNRTFLMYTHKDLVPGDEVRFHLYGTTEAYYNYMALILQQSGGGAGPFDVPPASARGNIINQTNAENYPFGYFRISEVSVLNYVVE